MEGPLQRFVNKHGRHRQFLFLVGQFLKIFSSETTWPNEPNLVGSIYGRLSIKIVHFGSIRNKHGRHRQFLMLIGRFLINSSTLKNRLAK